MPRQEVITCPVPGVLPQRSAVLDQLQYLYIAAEGNVVRPVARSEPYEQGAKRFEPFNGLVYVPTDNGTPNRSQIVLEQWLLGSGERITSPKLDPIRTLCKGYGIRWLSACTSKSKNIAYLSVKDPDKKHSVLTRSGSLSIPEAGIELEGEQLQFSAPAYAVVLASLRAWYASRL